MLADRDITVAQGFRLRSSGWILLIGLAFAAGLAPVVAACTVHDRCSNSDPACIFHSYTLVHIFGPDILGFVGAPALISLVLAVLLRMKATRGNVRADRAAWFFAVLSCLICLLGLLVDGLLMLPTAVLTVCAVAATPFPANPNDRLARSPGALPSLPRLD